jgi:UDPglucose 6-dehydrogenase
LLKTAHDYVPLRIVETSRPFDSPSIQLITALDDLGAIVRGYDPAAMEQAKSHLPDVIYCGSAYGAAEDSEAVVIVTEWDSFARLISIGCG